MSLTDRRDLLAGLGAMALLPATFRAAAAQATQSLALTARAGTIGVRPGAASAATWVLQGPGPVLRFRRGTQLEITLQNELPAPTTLCVRGIDGAAAAEPLLAEPTLAPGAKGPVPLVLRQAGTFLCDLRLSGDGVAQLSRPLALIVDEGEPVPVDRDEVFLVEDWRPAADAPALETEPKVTTTVYSVNGVAMPEIPIRAHERLRLRLINGCQRGVIAIKIEGVEVRIMALDGAPAEPFLARNGAVVLAPCGRADVFLDGTAPTGSVSTILLHDGKEARPIAHLVNSNEPPLRGALLPVAPALPSNGLPEKLDLKVALRVDLPLAGPEWATPARFAALSAPAFSVKAGRTVVLALVNHGASATVFHLHGHHFRLLDRLDDGWKPFWLDTLAVEPGQTQRIAFAADYPGRFLIEAVATDWAAPRLVRWYDVA